MIDLEEGVLELFEEAALRARKFPRVRMEDRGNKRLEVFCQKQHLRTVDRQLRQRRKDYARTPDGAPRNTLPDEESALRVKRLLARRRATTSP